MRSMQESFQEGNSASGRSQKKGTTVCALQGGVWGDGKERD